MVLETGLLSNQPYAKKAIHSYEWFSKTSHSMHIA
jgi:hypothetical protein